MTSRPKTDVPLADRPFEPVQAEQGHACISDGIGHPSDREAIRIAKASPAHTQRAAKPLRRFLSDAEAEKTPRRKPHATQRRTR